MAQPELPFEHEQPELPLGLPLEDYRDMYRRRSKIAQAIVEASAAHGQYITEREELALYEAYFGRRRGEKA